MTIREIANITGIPLSTVYRVLRSPSSAKPSLLQKIQEVAQEEILAYSLKKVYSVLPFLNIFYTKFLIHCMELFSQKGILVNFHIYNEDPVQEEAFLSSIILSPSIGLLWVPHSQKKHPFLKRKKNKIPIVSLFRKVDDLDLDVQLLQDNEQAMKTILQNLALENKKNITFINGDPYLYSAKQRQYYFEHLIKNYPNMAGRIITVDFDNLQNVYELLIQQKELLNNSDALIASSEDICYGVLKFIKDEKGLEAFSQVRIFSFDYSPTLEILDVSMVYFCPTVAAEKAVDIILKKAVSPDLELSYFIQPNIVLKSPSNHQAM